MRKFILPSLAVLAMSTEVAARPDEAFSFGPMFHWNFGGGGDRFSWALEAAYWRSFGEGYSAGPYAHGFDLGIEFQSSKRRIYVEYQNGVSIYGGSIGPVLEIDESGSKYGIQGGVWGALIAGVDVRFRYVLDGGAVIAPGLFAKLPYPLHGSDFGIHGN